MQLRPFPSFARAPDGAAGGAAPEPSPAGSGAADQTALPPEGGDGASIFDLADDTPKTDAEGKAVRPDWLPEQFWDAEKAAPRNDQLAKSWRDMRAMVSRGEHKPPETADAYELPRVEGLPDGLIGGDKDPLWPEVRTAAHAAGVTQKQLAAIAAPFLAAVAAQAKAAGVAPSDPEAEAQAARDAGRAELAKLGPNGHAMVRNVGGWISGLESRGVMTASEVRALKSVSTAEGVRALGKLAEMLGEKPIPVDAMQADDTTQADAQRMLTEAHGKGDQAMKEKALRILAELERNGRLVDPRGRR